MGLGTLSYEMYRKLNFRASVRLPAAKLMRNEERAERMLKTNAPAAPDIRGNVLLRSLLRTDAWLLVPHLSRVELHAGDRVSRSTGGSAQLFFPETVVFCVRHNLRADRQPALGLIGHEGVVGWSLLMGLERCTTQATVEMQGGTALSIPALLLLGACAKSPTLRASLLRYADNFLMQMASTLGSNTTDALERRIARWILMLHDRSDGDTLMLTHDDVARALHTRRASVTECFHLLEGEHILRCERARVTVRDRLRLEHIAGCAYGAVEAHYAADIAPWPNHVSTASPALSSTGRASEDAAVL